MEERQIYQLTSGAGYVVVVNGNFVRLRYSGSSVHTAVMAFPEDANVQSQRFDDAAEAVTWATSAAESHVGKPWRYSRVEHWESRQCYSITIEGGFRALPDRRFPRVGRFRPIPTHEGPHNFLNPG